MGMKKVYVVCGEAKLMKVCDDPLKVAAELMHRFVDTKVMLDPSYVYMDERGHREGKSAQFKVPVEQALAEAGLSASDFLFSLSADNQATEWTGDSEDEDGGAHESAKV